MKRYFLLCFVFLFALAFIGQVSAEDLNKYCKPYSVGDSILTCTINKVQSINSFELNVDKLPQNVNEIRLDFNSGETVKIIQTKLRDFNFVVSEINSSVLLAQPKLNLDIQVVTPFQYFFYISNFSGGPILDINFIDKSPTNIAKFFVKDSNVNISNFKPGNIFILEVKDSPNNYSKVQFKEFDASVIISELIINGQYNLQGSKLKNQSTIIFDSKTIDNNNFLSVSHMSVVGGSVESSFPLQLKKESSFVKYATLKAPKVKLTNVALTFENNSIFHIIELFAEGNKSTLFLNNLTKRDIEMAPSVYLTSTGTKTAVLDLNNIKNISETSFVIAPLSKGSGGHFTVLNNSKDLNIYLLFLPTSNPLNFYNLLQLNKSENITIDGPKFDRVDLFAKMGDLKLININDSNDITITNFQYYHTDSTQKNLYKFKPIFLTNVNNFVLNNSIINNAWVAIFFQDPKSIVTSKIYSNSFGYNNAVFSMPQFQSVNVFNNFFIENNYIVDAKPKNIKFNVNDNGDSIGKNKWCDVSSNIIAFSNTIINTVLPLPPIPLYYFDGSELVKKNYEPICHNGNLWAETTAIQGYKGQYLTDGSDSDGVSETQYKFDSNTHVDYAPLIYSFVKSDFNIPLGSKEFDDYIKPIKDAITKNKDVNCSDANFVDQGQNQAITKLFEDGDYKYVPFAYTVSLVSLKGGQVCTGYNFNVTVQNPVFTFKLGTDPKTITKTISTKHIDIDKNGSWADVLYIPSDNTQITITDINGIENNILLELSIVGKNKSASDLKSVSGWGDYSFNLKDMDLLLPYSIKVTTSPDIYSYVIDPLKVIISSKLLIDINGVKSQYDSNDSLDFNVVFTNKNPLDAANVEYTVKIFDSSDKEFYNALETETVDAGATEDVSHSLSLSEFSTGDYSLDVNVTNYINVSATKSFNVTAKFKPKTIKTPDNNIYFVFVLASVVIGFYLFRKS